MKHALLITAIWLLNAASPLYAQWNVGGLLNISNSTVSVDPNPSSEDYSGRFGFGIGAVLDRSLTGQYDLHLEPMYLQKGATIDDSGDEVTFKISYLEIPVMFRYNFQSAGTTMPYAMAGPSIGYLLNAKFESGGSEFDAKDQIRSFDLGIGIGGGVKIPKDDLQFFAEARYVLGLANINDDASDNATVKNRGIHVLFGVTIPLER